MSARSACGKGERGQPEVPGLSNSISRSKTNSELLIKVLRREIRPEGSRIIYIDDRCAADVAPISRQGRQTDVVEPAKVMKVPEVKPPPKGYGLALAPASSSLSKTCLKQTPPGRNLFPLRSNHNALGSLQKAHVGVIISATSSGHRAWTIR